MVRRQCLFVVVAVVVTGVSSSGCSGPRLVEEATLPPPRVVRAGAAVRPTRDLVSAPLDSMAPAAASDAVYCAT